MPTAQDTIVAVSSPPGRSPRGLVRVAGPGASGIAHHLLGQSTPPRRLTRACLALESRNESGALRVPVLAAVFPGPGTYTGDDTLELQLPGHPALLDRVVHRAVALGARLAEPGEFTFRAFLAGRIDLTRAEGVAATIAATSDGQLAAASMLRRGSLASAARRLVDHLATQLALVEAGIDFIDQEDVVPIPPGALDAALLPLAGELDDLLARSRPWGAVEALPRVVLVGPPSSGKSTLFNALLNRPRAVTSPTPGTTRDVLAEPLRLRGPSGQPVEVMLVDIAGLDDARTALDHDVQRAARDAIAGADLLLLVDEHDADTAGPPPAGSVRTATLRVRTKCDLAPPTRAVPCARAGTGADAAWPVSAATGQNVEGLKIRIAERLADRAVSVSAGVLALQPRHEAALRSALDHLRAARALLAPQRHAGAIAQVELVAGEMRAALNDLADLGGEMSPDDVIGRVFAAFCVGK